MSTQVAADIRTYVVDTWLSGDGRGLTYDTDLQEAGALDSLSALALVSFLEETYEIQLEPADIHLEAFRTVNAITALVARKTATVTAQSPNLRSAEASPEDDDARH